MVIGTIHLAVTPLGEWEHNTGTEVRACETGTGLLSHYLTFRPVMKGNWYYLGNE